MEESTFDAAAAYRRASKAGPLLTLWGAIWTWVDHFSAEWRFEFSNEWPILVERAAQELIGDAVLWTPPGEDLLDVWERLESADSEPSPAFLFALDVTLVVGSGPGGPLFRDPHKRSNLLGWHRQQGNLIPRYAQFSRWNRAEFCAAWSHGYFTDQPPLSWPVAQCALLPAFVALARASKLLSDDEGPRIAGNPVQTPFPATSLQYPRDVWSLVETARPLARVYGLSKSETARRMADSGWSYTFEAGQKQLKPIGKAVPDDPLALAIRTFMAPRGAWSGTAQELLAELQAISAPGLPPNPRGLSARLRTLARALEGLGLDVEFRRAGNAGRRLIHLCHRAQ